MAQPRPFGGPVAVGQGEVRRFLVKKKEQLEVLAKLLIDHNCHSERSEESRIFGRLRSFTPFRMTKKPVLQEAHWLTVFPLVPKLHLGTSGIDLYYIPGLLPDHAARKRLASMLYCLIL
jgi:hypothetical protein